ncbi:MAG: metalloregulator ArsR/SmtB family transcription factor [Pseudomonadota bacterium]
MSLDASLNIYRAIGEETRLRIMTLLVRGELTVSEITSILGQSQPRVSRHLKILADAGLVDRHREGAWMFYRLATSADASLKAVMDGVRALTDSADRIIARDAERFAQSRATRNAQAAEYFQKNASEWSAIRRLHLPDSDIESRMRLLLNERSFKTFIDLGTGAGRMLEIFADQYESAVGFDLSHEMLAIARANLESAGIAHAQVRHGDLFSLPTSAESADVVCIHHVLHYLAEPGAAIHEATRLLAPGGRLIISDFAPHDLEFLREEHAHRRLGFADGEVEAWCEASNLNVCKVETLSPSSDVEHKLTVKIWLCESNNKVRTMTAPSRAA